MTRIQSTHRYILLLILGLIGSMIQAFAQNNPVYVNPNVAQAGTDLFFCDTPTSQPLAVEIINPIMWANGASVDIVPLGIASANTSHSLLDFSTPGSGNLSGDPRLMDPSNGDFQLDGSSPAIVAGNVNAPADSLDLNGHPPKQGIAIDLGAYESPFTTTLETPTQAQLSFFPNPSQGQILLSLPHVSNHVDEVSVSLYDPL